MVCIFCNQQYTHESVDCNVFVTVEARKATPNSNRFCFACNVETSVAHLPGESECKSNEECSGWYSTEHHTLFCPERVKALQLFVPQIDLDLLSRFGDLFEVDEKYSMLLSSLTAINHVNLPKIKIAKNIVNNVECSDTDIVAAIDNLVISDSNNDEAKNIFDSIASKTLLCLPRKVNIRYSRISPDFVLQLLSSYTKEFWFNESHCSPNLSFSDIIKKAPNIESYSGENYRWGTNISIDIEKTWPDYLLKYKKGKNCKNLCLKFYVVQEFDIAKLREFIQTKCASNVEITIRYDKQSSENADMREKMDKIVDELYQYMEDDQKNKVEETGDPRICIGFGNVHGLKCISLKKWLPQPPKFPIITCEDVAVRPRNLPARAATKRKHI